MKYLVMASMLHAEGINPFDSQEARPYKDDPAMTNLVKAFHNNENKTFENILRQNEGKIMDNDFVRENLAYLLHTICTQVLISLIAPYTRISLDYIAKELNNIPVDDVESLFVSLILDGKLDEKIDQIQVILVKQQLSNQTSSSSATNTNITSASTYSTNISIIVNNASSVSNDLCTRNFIAVRQLSKSLEKFKFCYYSCRMRKIFLSSNFIIYSLYITICSVYYIICVFWFKRIYI